MVKGARKQHFPNDMSYTSTLRLWIVCVTVLLQRDSIILWQAGKRDRCQKVHTQYKYKLGYMSVIMYWLQSLQITMRMEALLNRFFCDMFFS